ncbi:hypothetical protein MMC13_007705 [Lambiella insularis]|nr:hypothetical protein [Lambiella insularis]
MTSHPNPSQSHNAPIISTERPSTAWSHDDDALLMRSRAQGMNWAPIAQGHFPNKTPNACRKRHERLMEKRNAENWDGVKLEDLARAYVESREIMWKILADKVGEKWQHVETKCMEKGLKTLQSAARPRRAKTSTSPTSPQDEPDDFDDSGLGPEGPPSDAGGHLDPSSSHQLHPSTHSSHHGTSSQSTPGASYASLHSSYSRGSSSGMGVAYPSDLLPSLAAPSQQQSRLPSFSSGFGQQMPSLASIFPGAPISASY